MPRPSLAVLAFVITLVLGASSLAAAPSTQASPQWQDKVDPWVLETGARGSTDFLVFLADQADLAAAVNLGTKAEKGEYVHRTLSRQAERTQGPLRRRLAELGVEYRPFWVANMIWVRGGLDVVQILAERTDVAHIYANPQVKLNEVEAAGAVDSAQPTAIEWNIAKVNAPQVWTAGVYGAGVVIGGQDTGYRWTHNALKSKYRGWNGETADHNYNWHDAIHTAGSICGANAPAPCDDYGHGTHTMGTMVGDDGGSNQVGMAPGAKWIGCRNMDRGNGTPATYAECYEWFVAPYVGNDKTTARPDLAPDVINNSWGCPASEGCTSPDVLLAVVQSVTAAGIVTVHSAGNTGSASNCATVSTPAAIYDESFTVGATGNDDAIVGNSSRGPVTVDGSNRLKPNIAAPGAGVRSSYYSSDSAYTSMSGTSMAGPHVAGLVALVISTNPSLRGSVDAIRSLIEQTAAHKTTTQACGGLTGVPNNVFGWGRIDANAAYLQACVAPDAIRDVAIAKLDASKIKLTWSPRAGAGEYYVWWDTAPYFAPGIACPAGQCSAVTDTSFTQAALGETSDNRTYVVLPRATCGPVQSVPSNRVGEFEFGLVKGTPQ